MHEQSWYPFPAPVIFEVEGRDALRYLSARLSNDIRPVSAVRGACAAALSPQGRVEGLFVVVKHPTRSECYYLWCTGGNREEVKKAFTRYIVADRVVVRDISDEYALLHYCAAQAAPLYSTVVSGDVLSFSIARIGVNGLDILIPRDGLANYQEEHKLTTEDAFTENGWNIARAIDGAPSFPEEVNDTILLPESGLADVVSFKKGCYTGQEVVEKISARGKAPRVMARYEVNNKNREGVVTPLLPDAPIVANGESIGAVVSSFCNETQCVGFALLKSKHRELTSGMTAEGCELQVRSIE